MAEQIAAGDAGAAAAARQGQGRMLLLSLAGAVLFGAGGFALAYLGRIDPGTGTGTATADTASQPGFVPIDRMIVSPGGPGRARHLRFAAEIEVPLAHLDEVTLLRPRIVDMLNGYLRAVDPDVIADPGALTELRAQMLRRIQVVAGEGRVNDFLIVEFVMD